MSIALKTAADELQTKIRGLVDELKSDPRMAEIVSSHKTLNALEEHLKLPKTSLASYFGLNDGVDQSDTVQVAPHDFFALPALDAAKKYLKKKGVAAHFDEILGAIKAGGAIVESEDDLRLSLVRSTYEIKKVGDMYGLTEWLGQKPTPKRKTKTERVQEKLEQGPISMNSAFEQVEKEIKQEEIQEIKKSIEFVG